MNNAHIMLEIKKLDKMNTSHILHLLLSVISLGVWIPVWIIVAIGNGSERRAQEKKIERMG